MSNNTGQHTAIFVVLFALVMLLIIYSSNNGNEVFHYASLRSKSHRPPNLKKWGLRNGYLPVYGNKTLNSHCHQCVIITSSSHLLGSKLGSEINQVLKKPQEFVNKTPETIFIFWGPPSKMQRSLLRIIQHVSMSFPNMSAYVVSSGRMKQFDDLFRGETGKDRQKSRSWLSTGWFTMVIAVELCDKVHVYGMVPPNYCSKRSQPHKMPYHYYEPKGPDECTIYIHNERSRKGNHHRFITEKRGERLWYKPSEPGAQRSCDALKK
ncbi:alpha-N-acetylgalactosaminide alpha-2,6-sialyltransferase 6 isoform C [Alligator mississippiensis]|nr:alpha-N-acetylgalactosaminide alpha-2,6-sialyltransferase 6 isoform C [Alligator mississippiensis]